MGGSGAPEESGTIGQKISPTKVGGALQANASTSALNRAPTPWNFQQILQRQTERTEEWNRRPIADTRSRPANGSNPGTCRFYGRWRAKRSRLQPGLAKEVGRYESQIARTQKQPVRSLGLAFVSVCLPICHDPFIPTLLIVNKLE